MPNESEPKNRKKRPETSPKWFKTFSFLRCFIVFFTVLHLQFQTQFQNFFHSENLESWSRWDYRLKRFKTYFLEITNFPQSAILRFKSAMFASVRNRHAQKSHWILSSIHCRLSTDIDAYRMSEIRFAWTMVDWRRVEGLMRRRGIFWEVLQSFENAHGHSEWEACRTSGNMRRLFFWGGGGAAAPLCAVTPLPLCQKSWCWRYGRPPSSQLDKNGRALGFDPVVAPDNLLLEHWPLHHFTHMLWFGSRFSSRNLFGHRAAHTSQGQHMRAEVLQTWPVGRNIGQLMKSSRLG